ncbi:MAG: hypothetical protein MHM6MM_004095 [Cercozoa sp. M6MM]
MEDWVKATDPNSGRVYYANLKTKQTQWTPPPGFVDSDEEPEQHAQVNETHDDAADLSEVEDASEWRATTDPSSGRTYYFNTRTKETTWSKPACLVDVEIPLVGSSTSGMQQAAGEEEPQQESHDEVEVDDDDETETDSDTDSSDFSTSDDSDTSDDDSGSDSDDGSDGDNDEKEQLDDDADVPPSDDALEVTDDVADERSTVWEQLARTQGDRFQLDKYAQTYFRKHKKGVFSKMSIPEMLSHQSSLLKQSLKKLNSTMSLEAVQAFKNIMSFMQDRKSSKKPLGHAQKLLRQMISAPEELRDEVYCQLCKQTTNNPKTQSLHDGWKLMALFSGIFPPSEEFACYLASYLYERSQVPGEVGEYARYALRRLDRCMSDGARRCVPCDAEIRAVQDRQPVTVRVGFLDGTFKSVLVDSQTNAQEVSRMLAKRMNIRNPESFTLAEMEEEDEEAEHTMSLEDQQKMRDKADKDWEKMNAKERFARQNARRDRAISKDERILDIVGSWQHKNPLAKKFRLVYKIKLFFTSERKQMSPEARRLYFVQAAYDVVNGMHSNSADERTIMDLAALQVQGVYGVNDAAYYQPGLLIDKLAQFVPKEYLQKRDHTYLEAKILNEHEKYVMLSRGKAQRQYIDRVAEFPTYGCTFFEALKVSRVKRSRDQGESYIIGIGERGVLLLDPETRETKMHFGISEILSYGFKDQSFLLVAGNLMQQRRLNFKTIRGRDMNELLFTYITKIVAEIDS